VERKISAVARMRAALDALAGQVEAVEFRFPSTDLVPRVALCDEITSTIRHYLIPRLGDLAGEAIVVVVGSTGSGKSTLVNSLAQRRISMTGAVRPTTTGPVVWCHREQADGYRDSGFAIVDGDDPMLRGVTVIDAPDFDSVVTEHRHAVKALLTIADLCVFVTSALRYADAAQWEFIDRVHRRGLPTVFVLNRLPSDGVVEIRSDYSAHLRDRGFVDGHPMEIMEQAIVDEYEGLAPSAVAPLRERLEHLSDPSTRYALLMAATRGSVDDVIVQGKRLVAEMRREAAETSTLSSAVRGTYSDEFVELETRVEQGAPPGEWRAEARQAAASTIGRHLNSAAMHAAGAWEADPAGRALLGRLWQTDVEPQLDDVIEEWTARVETMVEGRGPGRRRRVDPFDVDVAAVVASLAVGGLAGTAGDVGGSRTLLEQALGTGTVRSLVDDARRDLLVRLRGVFDRDANRFVDRVEAVAVGSDIGVRHATMAAEEAVEIFYGG
jgi:energy-coupling factor transporter ATP-binding protein EcfA2